MNMNIRSFNILIEKIGSDLRLFYMKIQHQITKTLRFFLNLIHF